MEAVILRNWKLKSGVAMTATTIGLGLFSTQAIGNDLMTMGGLDAGATGKVTSASTIPQGTFQTGVSVDGGDLVKIPDTKDGQKSEFGSGHQTQFDFSYGIFRGLELGVGMRGTHEVAKGTVRDPFFADRVDGSENLERTSYAGSRAHIKMRLINHNGFNLAIAPFVEEGMGQDAKDSFTKSRKARAGWLTMMGYGKRGVGALTLNLGARYRDPERLGDRMVRDEWIARLGGKVFLTRGLAGFANINARRLMVSETDAQVAASGQRRIYEGSDSVEALGGLMLHLGRATLSGYGGQTFEQGIGAAKNVYGVRLAMRFGSSKSAQLAKKKKRARKKRRKHTNSNYPEMDGARSDAEFANNGPLDDFSVLREKMKKQRKGKKRRLTEQQRIEKELAELQAADERRAAEERAALAAKRAEELEAQKRYKNGAGRKHERLRKRTRQDLDDNYSITAEDLEWTGLEE